jgi:hypothetical protein
MTAHNQLFPSESLAARASPTPLSNWVKSIGLRLTEWADYYAAAAMYEQLSGLSDAELARRGLSRATLAHDACVARGHNTEP